MAKSEFLRMPSGTWNIISKTDNNKLSIWPFINQPNYREYYFRYNADLLEGNTLLRKKMYEKKDGKLWAVIIFKNNIRWICNYKFSDDDCTFQIECSTLEYINGNQTNKSSSSIKDDTNELIKYLQDNSSSFICIEYYKMRDGCPIKIELI
jgi:hypothetical protein